MEESEGVKPTANQSRYIYLFVPTQFGWCTAADQLVGNPWSRSMAQAWVKVKEEERVSGRLIGLNGRRWSRSPRHAVSPRYRTKYLASAIGTLDYTCFSSRYRLAHPVLGGHRRECTRGTHQVQGMIMSAVVGGGLVPMIRMVNANLPSKLGELDVNRSSRHLAEKRLSKSHTWLRL